MSKKLKILPSEGKRIVELMRGPKVSFTPYEKALTREGLSLSRIEEKALPEKSHFPCRLRILSKVWDNRAKRI